MSALHVVALISGGKDSFFSILHCQRNGHKIVALANLHPPFTSSEGCVADLDSFMYQTIGHTVIPLYADALGLPLYRQPIIGSAINQNKTYEQSNAATAAAAAAVGDDDDETESLVPLLRKVMAVHPEVNAVNTGAILSDYQRTRVESVALRLGLTPLSYLWQWPNLPPHLSTSLLEDMAAVGQDSRIIKVASGSLDESLLWENVAGRKTIHRLARAAERFGRPGDGAALGEGGEYETLAVAGPAPLWKGRIAVPPDGIVVVPGEAGSVSVEIRQPVVVAPAGEMTPVSNLRMPSLLDPCFQATLDSLRAQRHSTLTISHPSQRQQSTSQPKITHIENAVFLCNLVGSGQNVAEQTHSIMSRMLAELQAIGHHDTDVAYTTITLRDMAEFAKINAVYGEYFCHVNPPVRVTIACADVLPADAQLMISFTSVAGPRECLHVQSRSYWAPANIGPYSQAIGFPTASEHVWRGTVFVAGQIPLVPASMDLVVSTSGSEHDNLINENVLALQHLQRVGAAVKVARWAVAIVFIAAVEVDEERTTTMASIAVHAWKALHEEESVQVEADEPEDFDVWHAQHGAGHAPWLTHRHPEAAPAQERLEIPSLLVIRVDSLPRGASFEWVGLGKMVGAEDALLPHWNSLIDLYRHNIVFEYHDG